MMNTNMEMKDKILYWKERYNMNFEMYEANDEKGKTIIYNLMQLYTYELSFFEDETTNFELLDTGLFAMSKYLELYWKEDKRHPYILKCNGELAGFVLQRYNENNYNEIAEFFVLNKYRKLGAGTFMANEIFKKFKGKWEIRTLLKNKRAQEFWRKIVKEVSNGDYREQLIRNNSRYAFYFEN